MQKSSFNHNWPFQRKCIPNSKRPQPLYKILSRAKFQEIDTTGSQPKLTAVNIENLDGIESRPPRPGLKIFNHFISTPPPPLFSRVIRIKYTFFSTVYIDIISTPGGGVEMVEIKICRDFLYLQYVVITTGVVLILPVIAKSMSSRWIHVDLATTGTSV